LQVSEEKLAVTLNSIGDGVIATDAKGRVTLLNPLAEQLTGWTQAEAIGHPVDEIFHIINQETRQPATIPLKETLAHGTIQGLANHTVLIARDGSECAIADSCAPIHDSDGQVIGAVLVFRDVTEEYATQQALQEKNGELESAKLAAEKANLAKSEFLSSMSHELRSPLNAILGFAQLMESDSPPPTSAQKESIAQILKAGWHLLALINEVLDLAKVESGQVPLSQEPVSLAEVMIECQGMIEPQAQQLGIKLTFPQIDLHYFVRADRTRLKQVLINLLSNAIKYNIKQGTVDVKCTESMPGRIRVSISNTGAGLSPEQLTQLFQAFNRLGQEAGGEEGTGIGLVVAKRLVELMGGVIGVESTVGVGSVFWFELISVAEPHLSMEGGEAAALAQPHAPRGARLQTLLYVEDNPANLKLVEQLIARRPDLRLLTAVTGHLGMELARISQPVMILMDINLPDISGIEAMKILHEDPATSHIPIVALSANAMPRDIEKGMKLGFFRYITKPIKVNEFMDTLNVTLDFAENGGQPAQMKQE
jgi:PAS domain S-box-containing protein